MPLSPGKLGHYEVLAPIGAGGMGEVWKARDPRLNRIVAIKQLKGQHTARFQQEAHAIAALNHPNICQIHDIGPDYLVMEYVEGKPLSGPLRVEEALKLALEIVSAMEEAHSKGILHRDLKPANILVTVKGSAKLLDFGLAKLLKDSDSDSTQTIEGTVLGTAAYMAPEQAEGKTLDERSDIFSFGAALYEMLSGNRAFSGTSTAQVLSAVLRDEPAPLQAPAELQRVVGKCLAKQPKDRFATMADLRVALEHIGASAAGAAKADRQPSIAVLPFANMSADKENEYFSDGLAEEILNLLAKIPNLKVIARTSSFSFRGKEQDIRKIAETLGVSHVLEGSVRRAGNRLRITAQLIHAADGAHLWSERYDRDLNDVFAIQDEIGQAISEALQVRLAPRAKTVNLEAYQHYLRGQYHISRGTPENTAKAKECFEQALAIDPNYAPAYGGLAVYYFVLAVVGLKPTVEIAPLAISAAEKALALDPSSSEAHSVLAIMAAISNYDWKLAEARSLKALAAEPVPPMVRWRCAQFCLLPVGRFSDAMEQFRLAIETDPLSLVLHFGIAWSMWTLKQYRESIEYARRALEIDGNDHRLRMVLGLAQLGAGLAQDAIPNLQRALELAPRWYPAVGCLAAAYYHNGDHMRSRECAQKLAGSHGQSLGTAIYYAATGEVDAMFDALEGNYHQRDVYLILFQGAPFFDPYRADPRFQALLAKMNLV
jgi:serine/threonine-protein kinase